MKTSEKYSFTAVKNLRLDAVIAQSLSGYSRAVIQKLIKGGKVCVNGQIDLSFKPVNIGDLIEITLPGNNAPERAEPENIPLEVVYEDDDFAVINKPAGITVHTGSGVNSGTLVNALLYRFKNLSTLNGEFRAGIVHRLDKDTSGLLIIAKTDAAHLCLAGQIEDRSCKRYYTALVDGVLKDDSGIIRTKIGRHPKARTKMAVTDSGRSAQTNFKVIKRFKEYTLVEFELITGRTHQIRVHCKHIGHSITGDKVYGSRKPKFNLDGQLLHAYKLSLARPQDAKVVTFEVPLPPRFTKILKVLE